MRKILACLFLGLLFCSAAGCRSATGQIAAEKDDLGKPFSVESPKRVAALTGSLADLWLLAGGSLAAVTQDAQEWNLSLPDAVVDVGGNKAPSAEAIMGAEVDFVLLSAELKGQTELRETLEQAGIVCASFRLETVEDYLRILKLFTTINGKPELYQTHGASVQTQVAAVRQTIEGKASQKVLLLRAYSTGVKAKGSDTLAGAMLKDLGCTNLADGGISEDISLEAVIAADPDFIFVTTMGESTEKAMESLTEQFSGNPAWQGLTAVKNGRFVILPKELFHRSPNRRWGESYEQLAEILYP